MRPAPDPISPAHIPTTRPEPTWHPDHAAIRAWMVPQMAARRDYAEHQGARSCMPWHACTYRLTKDRP